MGAVEGVFAASITPRIPGTGAVDLAVTLALFDFLASSGIRGIVLLGSTGEFPHFDLEERARLIAAAVPRSKVPVLVNVSHSSLDGSLRLAREAAKAGAAGLLIMPPYFFKYRPGDVLEYFRAFAGCAPPGLPRFLYNIPFFTAPIDERTAKTLLGDGVYAGIKDSSGDWEIMDSLLELHRSRPFTLLAGNDNIFARARIAGANGSVSGIAAAVPELLVALDAACLAGDQDKVRRLDARIQEFIARIDAFPTPVGVREAVALRGFDVGPLPVPLGPESSAALDEFREWFQGWYPYAAS